MDTQQKILEYLEHHKIGLAGYGAEGRSTHAFLERVGRSSQVIIADNDADFDLLSDCALIFRSPGVHPAKLARFTPHAEIVSQTSLCLKFGGERIIAVTGTKGKSTTSSALAYVLKHAGLPVVFSGNIGIPHFDQVADVSNSHYWVMELSAQQLIDATHAPFLGLWLNLFQEHLDYFGSFENYGAAKSRIFGKESQVLIASTDVPTACIHTEGNSAKVHRYTPEIMREYPIIGYNYNALILACRRLGVSDETTHLALASFQPLPSRLETVAVIDGVRYVDDCLATVPEAVLHALHQLDGVRFLILGGKDRGIAYTQFLTIIADSFPDTHLVLIGETGTRLQQHIAELQLTIRNDYTGDLPGAIVLVKELACSGDVCLLSPAAPSYDTYKDYQKKSEHYRALILEPNNARG